VDPAFFGKVENINTQLAAMLADAKRALAGEREFGVAQVRSLSAPIATMAPIMERSDELRKLHPEITGPLDLYKSQLRDLQITLEQVNMMLLVRRSQLDIGRAQMKAVKQWANALGQTR
jgi:hypothetical protein